MGWCLALSGHQQKKNVGSRTIFCIACVFHKCLLLMTYWHCVCWWAGALHCQAISRNNVGSLNVCCIARVFYKCPLLMTKSREIPQMRATGAYWWYVNTGSGNGLVPTGSKPIPKPKLTQFCIAIRDHYAAVSLTIKAWWGTHGLMHCVITDLNIILTEIDIIFRKFPQQYMLHPHWPWG